MALNLERKNVKELIEISVEQINKIIIQSINRQMPEKQLQPLQNDQDTKCVDMSYFSDIQYKNIEWPIELGFLFERLALEQTGVPNTQQIANKYAFKSLKIRRHYLGGRTLETANSLNTVGNCLYYYNKPNHSIIFIQEACSILLNYLGNLHQEVATNFNNIAFLLSSTGKIHESLKFHQKALKIRQKCFGEIHNEVALSYNNLAMTYSRLQQLDKSKEFQLKCITIWNEVWGGEPHPNIATAYNNLATNETYLLNYEKAYEYHFKAYGIRKAFFQDQLKRNEYPQDMIVSIDGIGLICMKLEKIQEALQYQKHALYRWLKLKGKNHNYGISLNNIAQTLKRDNKWEQAFFLMKVAYQKLYEKLGDNNPNFKNAKTNFINTKAETLKSNSTTERIISNLCENIVREEHDFNFYNLRFAIEKKQQEESTFGLILDYIFGVDENMERFLFHHDIEEQFDEDHEEKIAEMIQNQADCQDYNNKQNRRYQKFLRTISKGNPKFFYLMIEERIEIKKRKINQQDYFLNKEQILQRLSEHKLQEKIDKIKEIIEEWIKDIEQLKEKQNQQYKRFSYWKQKTDKQFLGNEKLWQEKDGQYTPYKEKKPRYLTLNEKILFEIENRIVEHLSDIDPKKKLPCELQSSWVKEKVKLNV